ncbi:hypothetical protein AQUCO_04100119v1 [Aquilegia coerulea]|uniref:Uncharacterized protein n=1 Tax=Aquilegia coerulea TaxID=218851 RepID=A0A2G5CQB1_AQUCA|nr:hypothetical protein AQUCO_04100119v1 [Aquilegia coerulea]
MGTLVWEEFSPKELYAFPSEFLLPEGKSHRIKFSEMELNEKGSWLEVRHRYKYVSSILQFEELSLWCHEMFPKMEFVRWRRHLKEEELPLTDTDVHRYLVWRIAVRHVLIYSMR